MIRAKHESGRGPRTGFLAFAVAGMLAAGESPCRGAAPETPAETASAAAAPSEGTPAERANLETRLQKIESALELILIRLSETPSKAVGEENRGSHFHNPRFSTPRPAASRPGEESDSGDKATLRTANRQYGLVYEQGRPTLQAVEPASGKVVWQCDLGPGLRIGDKAACQLSVTEDGKLLRLEAITEESSVSLTIDAETGRMIKQEITSSSAPRATVLGPRRVPLDSYRGGRYPVPLAVRPAVTLPGNSPQSELASLATSYVDAIGNLRLARRKYEHLAALRDTAAAPASELESATINLETALQKVAVLTSVAEGALETARAELDFAERMQAAGTMAPNQLVALKAKVKTLESIVQQRASASATNASGISTSFGPRK